VVAKEKNCGTGFASATIQKFRLKTNYLRVPIDLTKIFYPKDGLIKSVRMINSTDDRMTSFC